MNFSFLLDVLISILLATTIVWCVLLNRRLRGLRRNQGELATLIAELNLAASRAEAGISARKDNASEAGASLQASIDHAERLNDNLAYLSERGARLVERLDGPTKRARQSSFSARGRSNFDSEEADLDVGRREAQPQPQPRHGKPEFDEREDIIDIARARAEPDIAGHDRSEVPGEPNPARKDLERKLLDALKAAR